MAKKKSNLCLFFLLTFFFCSQNSYGGFNHKAFNSLSTASQLWEKGNNAFLKYNHQESIVHLKEALNLFEGEEQWSECVLVRCKIAENLDKLQRFEEMKEASEQAVELACKYLKQDDKAIGVAYHLLGEAYWVEAIFHDLSFADKQDLLKKAIAYFEVAEDVFREGNYQKNLIENHLNMGFIRVHLTEDINRAELYLKAAVNLVKTNIHENNSLYNSSLSKAYGSLMKIHNRFTGDFDKALEYAHLSLQHRLKLPSELPKDRLWLAGKYFHLGMAYGNKGGNEMEKYYIKKAEGLIVGLPPNELIFRIYHRLSFPYMCFSLYYNAHDVDHEESIAYHNKTLEVVESDEYSPKSKQEEAKIEIYGSFVMIYLAEMERDKANIWMKKFEEQLKKIPKNAEENEQLIGVYLSWANYHKKNGDFDAAISNLEKCFDYTHSIYNQIPFFAHNFAGEIYAEKGEYLTALNHFQKSLALIYDVEYMNDDLYKNISIEQVVLKSKLLKTLHYKAKTFHQYALANGNNQKFLESAFDAYTLAIEVMELSRQEFLNDKGKKKMGELAFSLYEEAIEVSLQMYDLTQNKKYKEQVFLFSEKSKANLLMEAINDRQVKSAYLPDSLIKKEKEFQSNLAFYEGLIYEEKRKPIVDGVKLNLWKEKSSKLKEEQELFRQGLQQNYTQYFELKYVSPNISVEDVKRIINDNQSFVEFFWGEKKLYAFVISPNQEGRISLQTHIIGDVKTLREQISTFVKNHENPHTPFNEYVKNSYGLYQKILHPIVSQLEGNITNLIIIPDGMLGYLPFEALITELPQNDSPDYSIRNLAYVIEDFQINYTYSASLLLKTKEVQENFKGSFGNEKVLMAYAPSFYGKSDEKRIRSCAEKLAKLNCAESEVYNLGEEWEGEVLIGETATKQHFLDEASNSDILHLATHACMDDHNPNFNRIYFSNDEYLSALELYTLQLNTQLTVLSACNTGSGQLLKGEGIMSLARGFMAAGCPSLITTLWGVNDCSSKKLMTRFYKHLYNGEEKDEALRNAKLDFLQNDRTSSLDSHPFYWAAFIQLGNRQAMFKERVLFQGMGFYGISGMFLLFGLIGWQIRKYK